MLDRVDAPGDDVVAAHGRSDPPLLLPGRWRGVALAVAVAGAGLLLAVGSARRGGALVRLDAAVADRWRSDDARLLDLANELLDVTGSELAMGTAVLVIARLAWWRWRRWPAAVLPVVAMAGSVVVADHVLKPAVAPTWPSGTIAGVTALAAVVSLLLGAHAGTLPRGTLAVGGLAVASVAAALVATGYHTASDLLGGLALGAVVAATAALAHDRLVGA